jgi:hypothetical protein
VGSVSEVSITQSQACSVGLPVAMQAIGKVCPYTTCQGSVVVNEFAARATPPPMRRVSKRLPTPQINRKTENAQAKGAGCV